jgi:threonylcarbamoyladenosine tRNA methylthiotransferase MtaB
MTEVAPQVPRRYVVRTLGCKANLYDSQLIEAELQRRGWKPEAGEGSGAREAGGASLCIVNSCTVTDEADLQSRKLASRLARENPGASIVITGCAAEVDPERLASSKGVHYIVGNQDKPRIVDLLLETLSRPGAGQPEPGRAEILGGVMSYPEILSRHPIDREWPAEEESFPLPPGAEHRGDTATTRAFLKIQEGCNAFCTYCIIPYGRGPSRSLDSTQITSHIHKLVNQGIREIVITGTNIGHYGTDLPEEEHRGGPGTGDLPLTPLFERIFRETALERLRVSSLDPTEITPGLLGLMEREPRFCPHFHVSLQSASDRVLRLMKRRYGTADVIRCLEAIARVRAPAGGAFVGMDVITGFPGETDAEFESAFRLLERLPWHRLHVFPYSERKGTPATRLPGSVPKHVRSERAKRLGELSLARLKSRYEEVLASGATLERVLIERGGGMKGYRSGYTPNYLRVLVPEGTLAPGASDLISVLPRELAVRAAAGEVSLICGISEPRSG